MTDKKQDWLPNWKNVAEYGDPATMTAQHWAWEFLRRSPQYQEDYKELMLFRETEDPQINKLAHEVINSFYGQVQFGETSSLPVAFMTTHLLPDMHKNKELYSFVPEVCWRLVAKYNLKFPLDPAQTYPPDSFIECDNLPVIETACAIMHKREIPDDRKLTISVDMGGHLKDQLDYIEGFLRAYRKQSKKRKSGYLDCLRFLDGVAGGAQWNIIARNLKKKRDAYYKIKEIAEELRDTGFFALSQSKLVPGKGGRIEQGRTDGKMFFETNASPPPYGNYISTGNATIYLKALTPPKKTD